MGLNLTDYLNAAVSIRKGNEILRKFKFFLIFSNLYN